MTLSVFTIGDRRKLQHYLNLPIQAVTEGSSLYQSLVYVEQLDSTEGTTIATDVQSRLEVLDCLESVDGSNGDWVQAIQSSSSQAKSISVPNQFSEVYDSSSFKGGYTGSAAALESYKQYLLSGIRRDLGLSRQVGSNTLNAVWPGGHSEPRRTSLYSRQWGLY